MACTSSISSGFAYLCMRKLRGKVESMVNLIFFGIISVYCGFILIGLTAHNFLLRLIIIFLDFII